MQFGTFTPSNGENAFSRYKVIAYASDAVLQDKRINLAAGIPDSLIVGDLVSTSGAKAGNAASIAFVVVEPAQAGSKSIVVASPSHVIISKLGIEFNGLDETAVEAQLSVLGFTFTDYDTVALRTT
ncbi:hypothetical protein [Kluyvera cryocrescens]|uniref:hypothetical protein n=1 Tax=Kluyvera cryocrescens TaxID=580 RepID=UPI002DB91FCE|nr:hypothetical protein [Kluyvera cryocrescens]MEB6633985.1 hypothetical protein [Kluyvera cryocrescens]